MMLIANVNHPLGPRDGHHMWPAVFDMFHHSSSDSGIIIPGTGGLGEYVGEV